MPPRVPVRAFASNLPPVASSSAIQPPPPPPPDSQQQRSRSIRTPEEQFRTRTPWNHSAAAVRTYRSAATAGTRPRVDRDSAGQSSVPGHRRSFHSSNVTSASAKNPYDVLGVKKDATPAEVKKTYYQLAKKWHPDTNKDKGANERFMEIQAAYDTLSDAGKRAAYDKYGSAAQQPGFDPDGGFGGNGSPFGGGGFGGFQDFGGAFGGAAGRNPGDLFESLFGAFSGGGGGAGGSRQAPSKGDDIEVTVNISFLESCSGVKRSVTVLPVVECKTCTGSGMKAGTKRTTCGTCKGTGQQTFSLQGMVMASPCRACGGAGNQIPKGCTCGDCGGVGRVKERKTVEVDIPAGMEDGMKVKMFTAGDIPLSGSGTPGDLYVRVNVAPSKDFRRQGTNLLHTATVPLHKALLGGKIRIPTLEGNVEVRVKGGTREGEEAVIRGRGVKSVYGKERGDLIVGWKIQIPRSLTARQKEILQAYADDVEGNPSYFSTTPPAPMPSTSDAPPASALASDPVTTPLPSSSSSSSPNGTRPSPLPEYETFSRPSFGSQRPASDSAGNGGLLGAIWSGVKGVLGLGDKHNKKHGAEPASSGDILGDKFAKPGQDATGQQLRGSVAEEEEEEPKKSATG